MAPARRHHLVLAALCWGRALGAGGGPAAVVPDVVVVVTCSAHYTDFFENWRAWLARLGTAEFGLVAIAEDAEAHAYLERRLLVDDAGSSYRRVVRSALGGAAPAVRETLDFESRGFASLMSRRAAHLLELLRDLGAESPRWAAAADRSRLVFSDLDVLWLRDPTPWFVGGCDAWAQTQHRERGLLNPGFLALAPTPGAARLLSEWARRLRDKPGRNLPVFNEARDALLRDPNARDTTGAPPSDHQDDGRGARVCALAPELFLSAKRSFRRLRWSPAADTTAVREPLSHFSTSLSLMTLASFFCYSGRRARELDRWPRRQARRVRRRGRMARARQRLCRARAATITTSRSPRSRRSTETTTTMTIARDVLLFLT